MNPNSGVRILLDANLLTRCRHRVHLDAEAARGRLPAEPRRPVPPGVRQRQEAAALHRKAVHEAMHALHHGSWVSIDMDQSARSREEDTLRACAAGVSWIWGGTLPLGPDGQRGQSELLMRQPDSERYVPIIVVNHKVTDPGQGAVTSPLDMFAPEVDPARKVRPQLRDQLRLAHIYRLLQNAGLAASDAIGGAIGYDADCIVVHDLLREIPSFGHSLLAEYDARVTDRIAVINGTSETAPTRIGECGLCEWWPQCSAELTRQHDVSLVVNGAQADSLRTAGVSTIDQLARWAGEPPEEWPGGGFPEAQIFAQAWLHDVTLVRKVDRVAATRADVEVDIDMESYQDHGAYLWGTLLSEPGRPPVYRAFATWEALPTHDEGRNFAEFWDWLTKIRLSAARRGLTFAAYCYSKAAENRWLLDSAHRFRGMNDVPSTAEITHFIESDEWIDMFEAVSNQFHCPQGRGLKKIAPNAGFAWRDPEAGGEASMIWYRDAVGYEGEAVVGQRERILRYNEDDVWATRVLREWMTSGAAAAVPSVADLAEQMRLLPPAPGDSTQVT
ncbi:TM0106 family RecB-like putative nuclease [Hoyosella sp. YIM 151337]|uniref:TM0106 family RecB-like putative nuclease n=1 Tax=Hoyosella sp. YIM 151337 TaxID=2992742 RepID=UPI002235E4EA|nr:TM0106 family RecB-like putative nuclease [Hoyosella sp. YIM 151337]MCW4354744.1 TM0106 family RecB-like putative nuclease [Hoyosella sp. YIM 151337]